MHATLQEGIDVDLSRAVRMSTSLQAVLSDPQILTRFAAPVFLWLRKRIPQNQTGPDGVLTNWLMNESPNRSVARSNPPR